MVLRFTKMHGLGNDFIVIDAREQAFALTKSQIQRLADRRFGIGFDQVLVLETSHDPQAAFGYRIFNADGNEVGQCGNGARCLFSYCHRKQLCDDQLIVKTQHHLMTLSRDGDRVKVGLGIPTFEPKEIPIHAQSKHGIYTLVCHDQAMQFMALSIGNPHAIITVNDSEKAPVQAIGECFQQHLEIFPESVNVGFMQIITSQHIKLRVYERGSGETLACGSGAAAAVAAGIRAGLLANSVTVALPGGRCRVDWDGAGISYLIGDTAWVYEGQINLADLA